MRVKRSIEKERLRFEARSEKIASWRSLMRNEFIQLAFHESGAYSEMRPYLSRATRESIEGGPVSLRANRGGNVIESLVLDDISALEKKWKLL